MSGRLAQAFEVVRTRGGGFALQVLVNATLPLIIFDFEQKPLGDVGALLASSVPPILWSLIEFARHRKLDALSIIVLAGIALSLLAFIGTGGAKFLQLRETLVGGLIGLGFLTSVVIRRPLIYYLARATLRRSNAERAQNFESMRDNVYFRRSMTLMTLVWGLGLITHTTINCILVFVVSISTYLAVSPFIGYGFAGGLSAWTYWYVRRAVRAGNARREAAEAEAQAAAHAAPAAPQPAES